MAGGFESKMLSETLKVVTKVSPMGTRIIKPLVRRHASQVCILRRVQSKIPSNHWHYCTISISLPSIENSCQRKKAHPSATFLSPIVTNGTDFQPALDENQNNSLGEAGRRVI